MNVVYTVRRSFPGPGGIATAMRSVAAELAREHAVRIYAARIDGEAFTRLNTSVGAQVFDPFWNEGVEIRPLPMGPGTLLRTLPMTLMGVRGFRRLAYQRLRKMSAYRRSVGAKLARAMQPVDVVHCWGGEHANWAGAEAASRAGVPYVVTPFAHPGHWGDDPHNVAFYRDAALVLALVPSEAAFYAGLGIDAARIRVVGVPVTPLVLPQEDVRARHGIGDDPLVLFLGVKEPYKGYRLLLEGAERIWERHPRARLAFVGPPTEDSREDFSRVRDDRIIEVGRVDDAEVAAWHRAATVFCLPSTSEIMPVSVLEAWSEGTPVVAARWWCAADLIEHGTDGVLTQADAGEVAAAVGDVLEDPERARAMGEAGRLKVATTYSPAAVAARHEAAYREAVEA